MKGYHKFQDHWKNREYVVEKWPYPNVPVYVVCPRDREGCSQTLHGNYLLPIGSNLEQDEEDASVRGVENINTSTPAPSVDNEPADAGPSGMVMSSTAGNTLQGSPDQTVPHKCSTWTTQNWLPWSYQNFGLLTDNSPSGIWDALVGLCICLHVISCLYTILWGSTVWTHSTYSTPCLLSATHFGIFEGNSLNVVSGGFWMGGGPKIIWPECNCPTRKKSKE